MKQEKFDEAMAKLVTLEDEIMRAHQELENKKELYQATLHSYFGIDTKKGIDIHSVLEALKGVRTND